MGLLNLQPKLPFSDGEGGGGSLVYDDGLVVLDFLSGAAPESLRFNTKLPSEIQATNTLALTAISSVAGAGGTTITSNGNFNFIFTGSGLLSSAVEFVLAVAAASGQAYTVDISDGPEAPVLDIEGDHASFQISFFLPLGHSAQLEIYERNFFTTLDGVGTGDGTEIAFTSSDTENTAAIKVSAAFTAAGIPNVLDSPGGSLILVESGVPGVGQTAPTVDGSLSRPDMLIDTVGEGSDSTNSKITTILGNGGTVIY